MKLKNIDWAEVVGFSIVVMVIGAALAMIVILAAHQPKPGPTIEEQLKVIQHNQQTMIQFLVQNHNRLNKRVDLLEQRQDGMLPLPKEEK